MDGCAPGGGRGAGASPTARGAGAAAARPPDPRADPARHRERARGDRVAHLQRAQAAAPDERRQSQRARPQARGGAVREVRQVLRGARAEDRVPPYGVGTACPGALPRPHGGPDPGDPRALGGAPFFVGSNFTMQSTSLHVAIVMDGNGRWATCRGLPRAAGHSAGARAVRRIVEAAPGLGIGQLTLFAFSADTGRRPPDEVAALVRLSARSVGRGPPRLVANGVRLGVAGRRAGPPALLGVAMDAAERAPAGNETLFLRLLVDYSGRAAIQAGLLLPHLGPLLRPRRAQRPRRLPLWECADAELPFSHRYWPGFGPPRLA